MALNFRFIDEVPVVEALVSVPAADAAAWRLLSRSVPDPLRVTLVVDTGSKRSCLTSEILTPLQRYSIGAVLLETTAGVRRSTTYNVCLEFPAARLRPLAQIKVVGVTMPPKLQQFHGVIGRDVLRRWLFCYNGPQSRLILRDRPSLCSWLCC